MAMAAAEKPGACSAAGRRRTDRGRTAAPRARRALARRFADRIGVADRDRRAARRAC